MESCLHRIPSQRLSSKGLLEKMLDMRNTVPALKNGDDTGKLNDASYNINCLFTRNSFEGTNVHIDFSQLVR